MTRDLAVHLLDVGDEKYSDAILLELSGRRVLIDGAHQYDADGANGIAAQLVQLLGEAKPRIDLLVVSHSHNDHVGCLPTLVADQAIDVDWALVADPELGWGRKPGEPPTIHPDDSVSLVVAGLREEPRPSAWSDDRLEAFLADAAGLEHRYTGMLDTLATRNTRIVRYGKDDTAPLLAEFDAINLTILGPSKDQLVVAAKGIRDGLGAINDSIIDLASDSAVASDPVTLYRRLTGLAPDLVEDATDRPGTLVNLQSLVLVFRHRERGLLMTGDMELANDSVRSDLIHSEVTRLRKRIRSNRPFHFAKLAHHGSGNGLDPSVLADLGRVRLFGISTGKDSGDHPASSVLDLLASRPTAQWARTDHNGLTSFEYADGNWSIRPSRGQLRDTTPPEADAATLRLPAPAPLAAGSLAIGSPPSGISTVNGPVDGGIQISVRLPPRHPKVRLTLEVDAEDRATIVVASTVPVGRPADAGPSLLWVTSEPGLIANLGATEAAGILAWLDAAPGRVLRLPGGVTANAASDHVRTQVAAMGSIAGIVLVGGYDVVPAHRVDVVPPSLASKVDRTIDADRFVVWSDEPYGRDPERPPLPVSRVPDGRTPRLIQAGLEGPAGITQSPRGVRNLKRPFAAQLFALLPGAGSMLVSEPTDSAGVAPGVRGDLVYLMLHGAASDGSRFFGERSSGAYIEAMNVAAVEASAGRIVLLGACWGALIVDPPAVSLTPGQVPAPRTPENSIALAYLQAGAKAVIGCTGSHYSPSDLVTDCVGKPLHRAFWQALLAGRPPAQALLDAKTAYVAGMPHGLTQPTEQAIEHKIFWEFTCLGVGW